MEGQEPDLEGVRGMKLLSDFIKELEGLKEKHGDLPSDNF